MKAFPGEPEDYVRYLLRFPELYWQKKAVRGISQEDTVVGAQDREHRKKGEG